MESRGFQLSLKARCFKGTQNLVTHYSTKLKSSMNFGIYIPDHKPDEKLPVLFFLSGLTCTTDNFVQKSGFQRYASEHRVAVVNPDTSPRVRIDGDDEDASYGQSASFYVDATAEPWARHYQMYTYIVGELLPLVFDNFPVDRARCGIFGHSMGGHGAITIGLRNPTLFKSISAFAPICCASTSTWGRRAFAQYFGAAAADNNNHAQYDALTVALAYSGPRRVIHVDQGAADEFFERGDLHPGRLIDAESEALRVDLNVHEGYDHSYFFVATFMESHFRFHVSTWATST